MEETLFLNRNMAIEGVSLAAQKIRVCLQGGRPAGSGRSPGGGNGNPLQYPCLEIPWTEKTDSLQFMGSQRVGHD